MRYERKYRIMNREYARIVAMVLDHPMGFRTHYPDRQVNNIYLDTPNMDYFQMNLVGAAERMKYRIRWYGNEKMTAKSPALELKIKQNELGKKETWPLPAFDFSGVEEAKSWVETHLPERGPLIPVLRNHYERAYYISADEKFRLTIDRELQFRSMEYDLPFGNEADAYWAGERDDAVILEIKYDAEHDNDWKRVAWNLPFRVGKNSKYVHGVLLTGLI